MTCEQLAHLLGKELNIVLYQGNYANLAPGQSMGVFTQTQIFHKGMFLKTNYIFVNLDFDQQP